MSQYLLPKKSFNLKPDPAKKPGFPEYLSIFEASQPIEPQTDATPNPITITNGEFGFNKKGLVVLKNNTTSLVEILDNLCIALAAVSAALITNPTTEPAAAAAGAALAASITALTAQVSILFAAPGTESN